MNILILNGPNLNLLGRREPSVYGDRSFDEYFQVLQKRYAKHDLEYFQSNSEGGIIDRIHSCYFEKVDGIVINPAAYTHYSYAIFDALKTVSIPTVEVHISDIEKREDFRKNSVITPACVARIAGEGINGYMHAIDILVQKADKDNPNG